MKNQKIFEKHTCTCPGLWEAINIKSTIIIDADFADINKESQRMIWFSSNCLTCNNTVVFGMNMCSRNKTGKEVFKAAVLKAALRTNLSSEEIIKALDRILITYYPIRPF